MGTAAVPAPSRDPHETTRLGGASDELAHLVKRERQSLAHSGLGDLASQRVRLEDELRADGEAGEEQKSGPASVLDSSWTSSQDTPS